MEALNLSPENTSNPLKMRICHHDDWLTNVANAQLALLAIGERESRLELLRKPPVYKFKQGTLYSKYKISSPKCGSRDLFCACSACEDIANHALCPESTLKSDRKLRKQEKVKKKTHKS